MPNFGVSHPFSPPAYNRFAETNVNHMPFYLSGCQLPPISNLLKDPSVEAKDTFVLIIQVQTPSSPRTAPIEIRDCHYVPRALLTALESSLDNATTGDVMVRRQIVICAMRCVQLTMSHRPAYYARTPEGDPACQPNPARLKEEHWLNFCDLLSPFVLDNERRCSYEEARNLGAQGCVDGSK